MNEHEKDVFHGRWQKSGLTEHAQNCNSGFDFKGTQTLAIETDYRRRKIREALEIRLQDTASNQPNGANRDRGNVMRTESWNALLGKLKRQF